VVSGESEVIATGERAAVAPNFPPPPGTEHRRVLSPNLTNERTGAMTAGMTIIRLRSLVTTN
jgi:hypothetical protein